MIKKLSFFMTGLLACGGCSSPLDQTFSTPRPASSSTYPALNTVPPRVPPYPAQDVQQVRQTLEKNAALLQRRPDAVIPTPEARITLDASETTPPPN